VSILSGALLLVYVALLVYGARERIRDGEPWIGYRTTLILCPFVGLITIANNIYMNSYRPRRVRRRLESGRILSQGDTWALARLKAEGCDPGRSQAIEVACPPGALAVTVQGRLSDNELATTMRLLENFAVRVSTPNKLEVPKPPEALVRFNNLSSEPLRLQRGEQLALSVWGWTPEALRDVLDAVPHDCLVALHLQDMPESEAFDLSKHAELRGLSTRYGAFDPCTWELPAGLEIVRGAGGPQLPRSLARLREQVPDLVSLDIQGLCNVQALASLDGMSRLRALKVDSGEPRDWAPELPALEELDFGHLISTDEGCGSFDGLAQLHALRSLTYTASRHLDADFEVLARSGAATLRELYVPDGYYTVGSRGIEALSTMEALEVLSLSYGFLDGRGHAVRALSRLRHLRVLTLRTFFATSDDIAWLQTLLPTTEMHIEISDDDEGFRLIFGGSAARNACILPLRWTDQAVEVPGPG